LAASWPFDFAQDKPFAIAPFWKLRASPSTSLRTSRTGPSTLLRAGVARFDPFGSLRAGRLTAGRAGGVNGRGALRSEQAKSAWTALGRLGVGEEAGDAFGFVCAGGYRVSLRNSSTLSPLERIRLRNVPRATSR